MPVFRAALDKFPDALLAVLLALAFALAVSPETAVAREESGYIQPLRARVSVSRRRGAREESECIQSLRARADQGDAEAQFYLGVRYHNGDGVPQDDSEAVKWYRRAAEQGLAGAQFNLGLMYDKGWGVPQDVSEAVKWYRRAAEQGLAQAQYNLGVMYTLGSGVPQNRLESYIWFSLAAANGYKKGAEYRDDYVFKLSPAELSSAQKEAARRHAEIQGGTAPSAFWRKN